MSIPADLIAPITAPVQRYECYQWINGAAKILTRAEWAVLHSIFEHAYPAPAKGAADYDPLRRVSRTPPLPTRRHHGRPGEKELCVAEIGMDARYSARHARRGISALATRQTPYGAPLVRLETPGRASRYELRWLPVRWLTLQGQRVREAVWAPDDEPPVVAPGLGDAPLAGPPGPDVAPEPLPERRRKPGWHPVGAVVQGLGETLCTTWQITGRRAMRCFREDGRWTPKTWGEAWAALGEALQAGAELRDLDGRAPGETVKEVDLLSSRRLRGRVGRARQWLEAHDQGSAAPDLVDPIERVQRTLLAGAVWIPPGQGKPPASWDPEPALERVRLLVGAPHCLAGELVQLERHASGLALVTWPKSALGAALAATLHYLEDLVDAVGCPVAIRLRDPPPG